MLLMIVVPFGKRNELLGLTLYFEDTPPKAYSSTSWATGKITLTNKLALS